MDLSLTDDERAFAAEVRAFLADHLELPGPFVSTEDEIAWGRAWQATLAEARMVGIHWPSEFGGRSATPVQVALYIMEYARARAPQPVNRVGINLAGPTLLACGTDEQRARWLPSILDASEIWCQLFSEPDAGSDLASLTTRAERADDGWLVSGQKVWTSYAGVARWGIALVRTDPEAPRHRGISYLVVDMTAPGIEVRPLVQITGEAEFNEVFLDEVYVPDDQLVGGLHDGWAVANTTLAHERGTAFPFKEQVVHEVYLDELYELAASTGRLDDVEVADELAQVMQAISQTMQSDLPAFYRGLLDREADAAPIAVILVDGPHIGAIGPSLRDKLDLPLRLALALLTGLALCFFLDYLDTSVRDRADLEALGLTVIGEIPRR